MERFNKYTSHHGANINQCIQGDTYKYFHPQIIEDFFKLDSQQYLSSLSNGQNDICLFQKYEKIPLQLRSDECNIYDGIQFKANDSTFQLFILIASTHPLMSYLFDEVYLNGVFIHIDQLAIYMDSNPIAHYLKQFSIKIVESYQYPSNFQLSQLLQVNFQIKQNTLSVTSIIQKIEHQTIIEQSQEILKLMLQRRYRLIKDRLNKIINNKKKIDEHQEIIQDILHTFQDKDVPHQTHFFLIIDYNRVGKRIYNYIEPICPQGDD